MPFKDFLYKLIGRISLCFDFAQRLSGLARLSDANPQLPDELDKTGRVVDKPAPIEILWNDDSVLYAKFNSFNFSFWRAQELSLFRKHRARLERPLLDFGCGDGSFASLLFDKIEFGLDIDQQALAVAKQFGLYESTLESTISSIPLADSSVRSVFSNSVLEHLTNLKAMLSEIHRILAQGGTFIFSVPVKQFERDLAKYFGEKVSTSVNRYSFHRNLHEINEWQRMLHDSGFTIERIHQYQPDWFTFWYRMFRLLGNRGFALLLPDIRDRVWSKHKAKIVGMVEESIVHTTLGSNILVIARKG